MVDAGYAYALGWVLRTWLAASFASCLWLPLVFGAYAIGRRQFSLRLFFGFCTVECLAIAWWFCVFKQWLMID